MSHARRSTRVEGLRSTFLVATALVASGVGAEAGAQEWRVSPEPMFTVGQLDGPPEAMFTRIAGAVRLPDGRYAVADQGELRITVYDTNGRLLSVFGREGEGPGEFGFVSGIWSAGGDTIGVWDSSLRRITWFRPDGTVVRTAKPTQGRRPAPGGLSLDGFAGTLPRGGLAFVWIGFGERRPDGLIPDRMAFGRFDRDFANAAIVGEATGMHRVYREGRGGGPYPFSPFPWTATVGDTLVYTDGLDGMLHFFPPDGSTRTVTVPGPSLSLDAGWRALDAALEDTDVMPIHREIVRMTDRSIGEVPRHSRMFTDEAGRIWLKSYDPSTDVLMLRPSPLLAGGEWTVVDTRGGVLARVAMPAGVAPITVDGDLVLAVARDELDVERFVVYRLVR